MKTLAHKIALESDLSPHAEAWIRARGFAPYAEIPMLQRCVDWIARDGRRLMCVEMKIGLNRKVLSQSYVLQLITPDVWCYIGRRPKGMEENRHFQCAKEAGLGVAWFDGERTVELLQPNPIHQPIQNYIEQAIERTTGIECGGIAGMKTMLGDGPAQDAFNRVLEYRQQHPAATWREIFANVPNHYSDYRSMQGAMRIVRDSRERRARIAG